MGQRGARRAARNLAAHLVDAALVVLFAPACAACGAPLDRPTQGAVCADCWASIPPVAPPHCRRCGDTLHPWRLIARDCLTCARCRRARGAVDRALAAGVYDGRLRAIVHALKYDSRRSLARPLGTLMRDRAADLLAGAACAVPVPLHPSRRRSRGFNQAADLAAHLGLPVVNALRRARATATQADLPAARRHANVRDAFEPTRAAAALAGTVTVLVDDVSTTGATLEACARTLKLAGVAEVRAVTAARVATSRT